MKNTLLLTIAMLVALNAGAQCSWDNHVLHYIQHGDTTLMVDSAVIVWGMAYLAPPDTFEVVYVLHETDADPYDYTHYNFGYLVDTYNREQSKHHWAVYDMEFKRIRNYTQAMPQFWSDMFWPPQVNHRFRGVSIFYLYTPTNRTMFTRSW